jgi:hypothetical protein
MPIRYYQSYYLLFGLADDRHKGYVQHSMQEIASQRVYEIVAGYEDANDCNKLHDDNIL